MKRILLLLLPVLMLASCERQYLVPSDEVPAWLKEIIREAEAGDSSSIYASDIGAWIRYKYEGNYYYEWLNPIMSSFPPVYDHGGSLLSLDQDAFIKYQDGKCCKKYVWKGSAFPDDYDEW